jgi:SAM-dependent methyltransferase
MGAEGRLRREHRAVTIHPSAAGFDRSAPDYERGRPTYPPEAVAWLVAALRIAPGTTVVDLAAGTGKLTRLLVPTGATVVAVEPVAGMREQLRSLVPGVDVLDGRAEAMPVAGGSVDAVTVAQAFHWFRGPEALAEIHRVLRAGGHLGLMWNRRDLDQPVQAEIHEVINRHRGETPAHVSGAWRDAFATTSLFGPLTETHFRLEQVLDADGVVARGVSTSFIAQLPDEERRDVEAGLRAIARRHGEPVTLSYVTDCYWCEASS